MRSQVKVCGAAAVLLLWVTTAGATLDVQGSNANKTAWNNMIHHCEQQDDGGFFANMINEIRNSSKTVTVKLVRGKANVFIDAFSTDEVDLDDLEDQPKNDPARVVDRCEWIVHILWERFHSQCTGDGFPASHAAAIDKMKEYRCALGYTDYITSSQYTTDYKRLCLTWADKTPPPTGTPTVTYIPVNGSAGTEGSAGVAKKTGQVTQPDGSTLYTFQIDTTHANLDIVRIPEQWGGGTAEVTGFSGTIQIVTKPSGFADHLEARVVSLAGSAPAIPLSVFPFSTGPNTLTATGSGESFGYVNEETGQVAITYNGLIVNSIYPAGSPLPFYSYITGTWDPANPCFAFHTAAVMFNGESGTPPMDGVAAGGAREKKEKKDK